METIDVIIGKDGRARIEVNGCSGPSCKDLTRELESALGKTVSEELKPEYHEHGQGQQQQAGF